MLKGKKILLGITGSIAAYKSVFLVRLLVKAGAEVKVIMTEGAKDFVTPLTFATLSKNKVLSDLFDEDTWANHVMLGRWADAMVVAPASCNTIAKMANGICDNLLLAVYLSSQAPVFIAPAMDEDMWHHPSTHKNVGTLQQNGNIFLPVNKGELASGLTGKGRMAEPEEMVKSLTGFFEKKNDLNGKKALVTAGPTYEAIDPVRFISNHSSGKMGVAIAEELYKRGAEVQLVLGPSNLLTNKGIKLKKVVSADEMYKACMKDLQSYNIIIMAAAVADYAPKTISTQKIKKNPEEFSLELKKTKDILFEAGKRKSSGQTLVGFALETNNEKENAIKKLRHKNADLIVLNSTNDEGAGFGLDTNRITIFDKKGKEYKFPTKSKEEVAEDIVNTVIQYRNE
ncbi:MAG: bifunctional phosphopantothenoylcysteine decarboxylase/phosphopantothenate--cysteine ligase CoaBC [Bacteroidota bacterium]|nr:bifunctional phosphopantothenoylcysteine decarboxylase/phosphopantothenate--cysteine ligase CoaBC [Bacteroidota bacterium]